MVDHRPIAGRRDSRCLRPTVAPLGRPTNWARVIHSNACGALFFHGTAILLAMVGPDGDL